MPHIIVEYSDGLETEISASCLLDSLLETAMEIEALPIGGLRLRAVKRELSRVGDGDSSNQFVYIVIRLGRGRSDEVKTDIGSRLFGVLTTVLQAHFDDVKTISLG